MKKTITNLWWLEVGFGIFSIIYLSQNWVKGTPHALGEGFDISCALFGLVIGAIIIKWSIKNGRLDIFELPTWFTVNLYIQVIANIWLFRRDSLPLNVGLMGNFTSAMEKAILIFGVGIVSLWIGYITASAHRARREITHPHLRVKRNIRFGFALILWMFAFIINITSVTSGIRGIAATQSFIWFNYLSFILLIYFALTTLLTVKHFGHPSTLGWIWLIINTITNMALSLISGSRGATLVLLRLLAQFYYTRRKIVWRWIAIGVILTFILVPVGTAARNGYFLNDQGNGVDMTQRQNILAKTFSIIISRTFSDLANETKNLFITRQGTLLDITAAVSSIHPAESPYMGIEITKAIATQMIPRFLWPNKPSGDLGLYDITGMYWNKYSGGFSTIGIFGDSYRFGGWIAVIFIGLLIGMISAWIYPHGRNSSDPIEIALYLSLMFYVLIYDTNLITLITGLIQKGILLWLFLYLFISKKSKNYYARQH